MNQCLLSERKIEILQAFVSGASSKYIAMSLGIRAQTVKIHLNQIKKRMGVDTRQEMVALAVALGYVHVVREVSQINSVDTVKNVEENGE